MAKKIGLALGSGGVKGLAHIGVIKVLEKNNIPIDYIAGSSIGALIGAGYAFRQDIEKIEKIAMETSWKRALHLLDPGWPGGIIKGRKVEKLIKEWLPEASFDNLKIPLAIVATDILSGQRVNIKNGDIIKAILASLAVPPIFKPVEYENYLLSDGGLSNPLPANVVREMGADIVIAVNLDSGRFKSNGTDAKETKNKNISITKVSVRALNIMRYYLARKYQKLADFIIEPLVPEVGLVGWNNFFDTKKTGEIIKAGETAALASLAEIKKSLNY